MAGIAALWYTVKNGQFMLAMTAGSIDGSFNGGRLLGVVLA